MKPDWDKLGSKFNYKGNAHIVDVDCTTNGKQLCEKYGVSGYPTIKYFKKGGDSKGTTYEGGREFNDFKKFTKKMSKKPCNPNTLENCGGKDKKYIEEIKDWDEAKLKEEYEKINGDIEKARKERDDLDALFEKQKDEAMATQKLAGEAKKASDKLSDKFDAKLSILRAKVFGVAAPAEEKTEEKKEEL